MHNVRNLDLKNYTSLDFTTNLKRRNKKDTPFVVLRPFSFY